MRIIAAISVGLAVSASVFLSAAQQGGSLVTSLPNDVHMEFVSIAPGEFTMGCSPGDGQCSDNERPAHRVRITRGFEMGKYEVTSAQWQAVMVTSPVVSFKGDGDNHAVGFVGWAAAQDFLERLNARGADLSRVDLEFAVLKGGDLTDASLKGAQLGGADLTGITVIDTDFDGADLDSARLIAPIGLDRARNFDKAKNRDRLIKQ